MYARDASMRDRRVPALVVVDSEQKNRSREEGRRREEEEDEEGDLCFDRRGICERNCQQDSRMTE